MRTPLSLILLLLFLTPLALSQENPYALLPMHEQFPRYWESPSFEQSNQNITKLPLVNLWGNVFSYHLSFLKLQDLDSYEQGHYALLLSSQGKKSQELLIHLQIAHDSLELSKQNSSYALSLHENAMRTVLNSPQSKAAAFFTFYFLGGGAIVHIPFLAAPAAVSMAALLQIPPLADYILNFGGAYKSALTNYVIAHEHAGAAANIASEELLESLSALDFAGAGNSGYSGPPKKDYVELGNWLFSEGGAYLPLQGQSNALLNSLNQKSPPSAPSAALLSSLIGAGNGKNLIESLLLQNSRAKASLKNMQDGADLRLQECNQEIISLQSAISLTTANELSRIDERSIYFLEPDSGLTLSEFAGTLSDKHSRALSSLALAQTDEKNSRLSLSSKNKNYLYSSLSYSENCITGASSARSASFSILKDAQAYSSSARTRALHEIESAENSLASYSAPDSQSAIRKSRSEALLSLARENLTAGDAAAQFGKKFDLFYNSAFLAQAAKQELFPKDEFSGYLPGLEVKRKLAEYKSLIDAAKKDGPQNTLSHEQLYSEFKSILDSKTADGEILNSLSLAIDSRISELYLSSSSLFSPALEKRARIKTISPYFISLLPEEISSFNSLESKYFRAGSLYLPAAVGHFQEIDFAYSRILSSFSEKTPLAIQALLTQNAKAEISQKTESCIGEPLAQSIQISLANPSPLSSPSPLTIKLPLETELRLQNTILLPNEVTDVSYSPSQSLLSITLSSVPANSQFSLSFQKSQIPAEFSSTAQTTDATPELALIGKEISFDAIQPLPSLCAKIPLPDGAVNPKSIYNYKYQKISRYPKYAKITLENAGKGSSSFFFSYELPEPYSLSKENISAKSQGESASISYFLVLSSAKQEFESLPVSQSDYSNESVSDFALYPISPHQISSLRQSIAPTGISYSFTLKRFTPDYPAIFRVSYTVDNSASYSSYLYSLFDPSQFSGDSKALALYSDARTLLSSRDYSGAIKKMMALQSLLEQKKSSKENTDREYLLQENKTSQKISEIENSLPLLEKITISLPPSQPPLKNPLTNLTLAKKLLTDAQKEFSAGNANTAISLLLSANENLAAAEPATLLLSLHESLSKESLLLQERAFSLSLNQSERLYLDSLFSSISLSLSSANTAIFSEDFPQAISSLQEAQSSISKATSLITTSESSSTSSLLSSISDYEQERAGFSTTLERYSSHYSKAKELKVQFTFPKTPKQISDELDSIGKAIAKISSKIGTAANSGPGLSNPSINPASLSQSDLSTLHASISSFQLLKNQTLSTIALLEKTALSSHSLAESSISRLKTENLTNSDASKKLNELASRLSQSASALRSFDYPASLSLTSGIPKDASLILSSISPISLPAQDNGMLLLALATLALLSVLAFFLLFSGKNKKPPKKLGSDKNKA